MRFKRRLLRLFGDFEAADDPEGELHVLTFAFFRFDLDAAAGRR